MEENIQRHFNGALKNGKLFDEVNKVLRDRGFTTTKGSKDGNTLFATSCCPDEINRDIEIHQNNIWGRAFTMGGLAGFPFVGKTGLSAFLHHAPTEGKVFIIVASHCGILPHGELGRVKRDGMIHESTACGASVAAYETVKKDPSKAELIANGDATAYPGFSDPLDSQQNYVQKIVAKNYKEISEADNPQAALAKVTYTAVRKDLDEIIASVKPTVGYAILGGVQINVEEKGAALGEDWFYVRQFEFHKSDGSVEDLKPLLEHQKNKKRGSKKDKKVKKDKKEKKN